MFTKAQFGARLREQREKAHETQATMKQLLGVTTTQISDMENGKATTTLEKFALLCEHYEVSADYLLGLTDDPKPYGRKEEEP